jgi:hypothetical protein
VGLNGGESSRAYKVSFSRRISFQYILLERSAIRNSLQQCCGAGATRKIIIFGGSKSYNNADPTQNQIRVAVKNVPANGL